MDLGYSTINNLQLCLRRFLVGVAGGEVVLQLSEVCAVEVIAELMEFGHHVDVCQRVFVAGEFSQSQYIIFSEHSRDNDTRLVGTDKFGVHHHTGYTTVAVIERMHLTNHEHHEYCTGKWVCQG